MATNNKPTILLVDPCSMTRQCMTVLLNAKKYMVLSTPSIRDAMEMIKVHKPDLIVHELALPDGSASKLIRQARSTQDPAPSFFMLTDEIDQSKHLEVLELRVMQVMIKREFTIKQFYAKIDAMLGDARFGKPLQLTKTPNEVVPKRPVATGPKVRSEQDREELYKSIPPLLSEEEVTECLNSFTDLRAMSPIASKVIELTSCNDSTLESIADAIRTDPAIAVKLIRIANSAAFARPESVSTPLEAVRRLGLQQVRQHVTNLEIMENLSDTGTNTLDAKLFWEHSLAVASASAMIAKATNAMSPDLAYTAGLLHDMGRLLLSQALEEDYPESIQFARENQLALDPIERRMFGVDHASVMDSILKKWDLSDELIAPIVHHHKGLSTIELDCPDRVEPVAIVSLADRLAHALSLGCSGNLVIYPTEEYFAALSLQGDFLSKLAEKLPAEVQDMRSTMLGEMGSIGANSMRRACAGLEVRPKYITRHQDTDAIRYWVESLDQRDEIESDDKQLPNLFVVRLRTKRDALEAEKTITAMEMKHQLDGTPVIAISDSKTLNMTEVITSTREARLLTTPFTVDEFERCALSIPELSHQDRAAA
jgi:putative nucleotidyltransferase with HDIG domain